ncbi:DNA replication and repair protein RecF [Mycolicibacterium obuense]|uniref:DNA replication and repair protein RecF n=2 Tax=Mycolicibacterium obuense TaxID=1807 RepID=A0A0J6WH22_9MYCO|nr:DNA replication and repair protein RecF [Mycolicibacterium obuense]
MKPESATVPSGNGFDTLRLHRWRQFEDVDIDFHPRLTVLTGANASGKTTILNLLGRHFNWQSQFLAVPRRTRSGPLEWLATYDEPDETISVENMIKYVGELRYWDGSEAQIAISKRADAEIDLSLPGSATVRGIYVSSHRTVGRYQKLATIPSEFSQVSLIHDQYWNEAIARYSNSYTAKSPITSMKESLIAAATWGASTADNEANVTAQRVWTEFQEALRLVLPDSFRFQRLVIRSPELLIYTDSGEFLIDSASGGIASIIELTWQVYLRSWDSDNFTVCIDEPENHLHPSLQRSLIPGLLKAFPRITFIAATHSPFIVTSVADSNVYVLAPSAEHDGKIISTLLDTANKSGTADEILRRVLGVPTTIPIWAENQLQQLIDSLEGSSFADKLRQIQDALTGLGFQDQFPAALDALEDRETGA